MPLPLRIHSIALKVDLPALTSAQTLFVLAQSVSAGGFLAAHYGMLDMHHSTAFLVALVGLLQVVATV